MENNLGYLLQLQGWLAQMEECLLRDKLLQPTRVQDRCRPGILSTLAGH